MCGIVGIINGSDKIKNQLDKVFTDMLWADQIRGVDGAGVFWYDGRGKGSYDVRKDIDINKVLEDKSFEAAMRWVEKMPFVVGHNRSATRGTVTSENNHPFDEGNVVLVHNGTMTHIPKEYDDGTKVDSHAIAKMLHKASTEDFMKKSFGAYALVWFDKVSRKLNLLRNSQRPLFLVHYDDFTLISSEAGLASWCAGRHGFSWKEIEPVKEHHLYQYDPYDIKGRVVTDLSELKKPMSSYSGGVYNQYGLLDDDEVDEYSCGLGRAWVNPTRPALSPPVNNVVSLGTPEDALVRQIERAKATYRTIDPWQHFLTHHGHRTAKDPTFAMKLGSMVVFTMDSGREYGSEERPMVSFVGNIPGKPIKEYCVKGNVQKTLDEVESSQMMWKGIVSSIVPKNGKITIWLRDVEESSVLNPDLSVANGGPEQKKS